MKSKQILLVTGEISGEQHACYLVQQVRQHDPSVYFYGMGSHTLQAANVDIILDNRPLTILGITQIVSKLPVLYRAMRRLKRELATNPPDLLVLIDYSGFNLILARYAKRLGIKILYYVSPQIWAWRYHRIKTLKRCVNHMAVILPFEEDLYKKENIPVSYVGHPLTRRTLCSLTKQEARQQLNLASDRYVIGLLPGSRRSEINSLLKILIDTAAKLQAHYQDVEFILPLADSLQPADVNPWLANSPVPIKLIQYQTYTCMRASDLLIMASGTATLEAALIGTPMIVTYRVNPFNAWLARLLIKNIQYISLCNIVAQTSIVPELIQEQATPDNLFAAARRYREDTGYYKQTVLELDKIRARLTTPTAQNIGKLVLRLLN